MTLAQKIANSHCRICGEKGHWKAECSKRPGAAQGSAPSTASSVPISWALAEEIPPEIQHLPMMPPQVPLSEPACCLLGDTIRLHGDRSNGDRHNGDKLGANQQSQIVSKLQHALRSKMLSMMKDMSPHTHVP